MPERFEKGFGADSTVSTTRHMGMPLRLVQACVYIYMYIKPHDGISPQEGISSSMLYTWTGHGPRWNVCYVKISFIALLQLVYVMRPGKMWSDAVAKRRPKPGSKAAHETQPVLTRPPLPVVLIYAFVVSLLKPTESKTLNPKP